VPKSFYLIDGHAQIYRAYFAPFRDLTGPNGEPTKATFVFTQMLINLVNQRKPDYLAMVIDAPGPDGGFRLQIDPQYKANRESPPSDFEPQERRILQIVRDAGVPIFQKQNFEADDVIATIARQVADRDVDLFLVSKDKDLRQLLGPRTRMYDVQSNEELNAEAMQQKFGYSPAEAIEIQTLMGDAVDNVRGIPGVGEKTAVKLLRQFGSIEGIYAHLDELTPKLRENLIANRNNLPIAKQLVTLRNDVDVDFDFEKCAFTGLNVQSLLGHLESLGFHSLIQRLGQSTKPATKTVAQPAAPMPTSLFPPGAAAAPPAPNQSPGQSHALQTSDDLDYHLVDTEEKFAAFLKQLKKQKRFAFDTETTSHDPNLAELVGMSFSWQPNTGSYLPVKGPPDCPVLNRDRVLSALRPILENPAVAKVGHNIKYDLLVMRHAGITLRGIRLDSMIAAFLLDAGRLQYGIDRLAMDLLSFRKIATVDLIGKGKNQITIDCADLARVARYAAEDVDIALRLADRFSAELDAIPELRKLADDLETPLIDVLAEMEFNGIAVDPAVLKEQSTVIAKRIDELRASLFEHAKVEFNPDSPKQLQDILFNRLGLKSAKKTKTGFSTDVEVLEKLAEDHPLPRLILDYRALVKLKNTYLDNLTDYVNPRTGRIHGSFNPTGAATGRLSMSDPNLQNIPIRTDEGRRIRLAFVPGDPKRNVLLTADYSQVELRILAHLTQEPGLLKAFRSEQDIHTAVASEVFKVPLEQVTRDQRGYAKTINFGIIYGVSAHGLARRIEGLDLRGAAELIETYHQRFPGISAFARQCVADARNKGYVTTILGRRRPLPDINSAVFAIRSYAERAAINSVVQGSAADLIKMAMLNIYSRLQKENRPSKLLLQVHDELLFETSAASVEDEAAMVRQEMTTAMKLSVPIAVEVAWARNWQEVS
jgi:DNA polymerase-1